MRWIRFFWLCLLVAIRCEAAIYQWTDSSGRTQFSDRPPMEQVEVIERRDIEASTAAAPPPPKRAAASTRSRTDSPRKIRHSASGTSEREQARKRCDKIRHRIATTQSQQRAGYSARRGIMLAERLRAERDTLYHECRY